MYNFLQRVSSVQNGLSVSAFARKIGMQQKTVDLYMKGERKPSVEFIKNICTAFDVSADWLLGLPDRGGAPSPAPPPSRAAASMPQLQAPSSKLPAPSSSPPPDCSRCQLMAAHIREITGRK